METLKRLREWIAIEEEALTSVNRIRGGSRESLADLLLYELAADTAKHIDILKAIIDLLEGRMPISPPKSPAQELLREHMEKEEKALEFAEELLKEARDEYVRILLRHLVEDERRHHEILDYIAERLMRRAENFNRPG